MLQRILEKVRSTLKPGNFFQLKLLFYFCFKNNRIVYVLKPWTEYLTFECVVLNLKYKPSTSLNVFGENLFGKGSFHLSQAIQRTPNLMNIWLDLQINANENLFFRQHLAIYLFWPNFCNRSFDVSTIQYSIMEKWWPHSLKFDFKILIF